MLSMVFGLPVVFGALVWHSYRSAAQRRARGETLVSPGVERWEPQRGSEGRA